MAEVETLVGILDEIQSLVSDKLQVVSHKWLSRNFFLPSNTSKRLLQEFVEKHGNGLEVVYTLCGRLKNNPSSYHVKLVSGPKLSEAKQEYDGDCSVQVYSVQTCIPKDPAALWNAEFVQAEELFRQPPTADNRFWFCGISNSSVKHNSEGTTSSITAPQAKNSGLVCASSVNSRNQNTASPQPEQKKVQQPSPKIEQGSSGVAIKTESHVSGNHEKAGKLSSDKDKTHQLPANKKKGQNDKTTSGNGGSLANMWNRASAKPKTSTSLKETNTPPPSIAVSAEAQISALEAIEGASSDDDDQDLNFKRASNGEGSRKRRVVLDYSDDEDEFDDAVNLASPDPPKTKSFLEKQITKSAEEEMKVLDPVKPKDTTPKLKQETAIEKKVLKPSFYDTKSLEEEKKLLDPVMAKDISPKLKQETAIEKKVFKPPFNDSLVVIKGKNDKVASSDKVPSPIPENNANMKDKASDAASTSPPKRRKVLKTRIDERGREVTEVVWEGADTEAISDVNTAKKVDNPVPSTESSRPPAAKKSPAVGSTVPPSTGGKAGSKKAGGSAKDPKQGNIMSFFKKKG